jgi:hypothetical protein
MSRTFTVVNSCINVAGGRYKSATPASAAKKAATKLFKKAKDSAKYRSIRRITFSVRETTVGSDKNVYEYKANRVKLDRPVVRVINGVEIVNHFKIDIVSNNNKQNLKCKKIQKADSMASMNSMGGGKKSPKKVAVKKSPAKKRRYKGGENGDGEVVDQGVVNSSKSDTAEYDSSLMPDTSDQPTSGL